MSQGKIVCLVNRTSKKLQATKNGIVTVLQPGDNYVNADLIRFAKNQNPMRGSQDPNNPLVMEYLVGVKDTPDNCEPITDEDLSFLPSERINRSLLAKDRRNATEEPQRFPRGRVGMDQPTAGLVDPGSFNR